MSKSRQILRNIYNTINENKDKRVFAEAIVKSIEWTSKTAVVEILPEGLKTVARVGFSKASIDEIGGAMPTINSKCIVMFLSQNEDIYEDVIVMPIYLFDSIRTKPSREDDGNKDKNYHSIKPKNGGKIDFYKGNDTKDRLLIQSKGYLNVLSQDFVSVGAKEISGDDNWVVLSKHLEVYNNAIEEIKTVLSSLTNGTYLGLVDISKATSISKAPADAIVKMGLLEAKLNLPTASGGLKEGVGSWNRSNKLKSTK